MSSEIEVSVADGIQTIRINRSDKKNAITSQMYVSMANAISAADVDDGIQVTVFCGAGDSFSAGNDLKDFLDNPPEGADSPVMEFLRRLMGARKPVVAAVKGNCVGIGTTLLLHCDLVYAADNSRFILPFVNLALCPEAASSFLLPLLAGRRRASAALLLAEPINVTEAREMGLINEIVDANEVENVAFEKAKLLASKSPNAIRATRALMRDGMRELMMATFDRECVAFAELVSGPDAREAFTAFMEKRPPKFGR